MTEAIITKSADGAAGTTLRGEVHYMPVSSKRTVVMGSAPVGQPASDEATRELRQRLRGDRL